MTFVAWLWSYETLLDTVTLDPHTRTAVSADYGLRSKFWYKGNLQNGYLNVLIKLYYKVQHFLPIWLLGSNPKKIKHRYIFMKGFSPTSGQKTHCCIFLMPHFRAIVWTLPSRVCVHEKDSAFWSKEMSWPSLHITTSTILLNQLYIQFQNCQNFIFLVNYSAVYWNFTVLSFSHESGLKGLCYHTAVHRPICCAWHNFITIVKARMLKITL